MVAILNINPHSDYNTLVQKKETTYDSKFSHYGNWNLFGSLVIFRAILFQPI